MTQPTADTAAGRHVAAPGGATDTFVYPCHCGGTVRVEHGTPQAHECLPADSTRVTVWWAGFNTARDICYAGAAETPGTGPAIPTPAEWLRRLFNQDAAGRLETAKRMQEHTSDALACYVQNHRERLIHLEHQLAAATEQAAREAAEGQAATRTGTTAPAMDAILDRIASPDMHSTVVRTLHTGDPAGPMPEDEHADTYAAQARAVLSAVAAQLLADPR